MVLFRVVVFIRRRVFGLSPGRDIIYYFLTFYKVQEVMFELVRRMYIPVIFALF